MKRLILALCLILPALNSSAQRDAKAPEVKLMVADSMVAIEPSTTQTQLKKGWNIVGYNVGDKTIRYLWGKHSKQFCDNRRPTFSICPQEGTLNDFTLIKLKAKRDYRQLPQAIITDNMLIHIEPDSFSITMPDDDTFVVQPTNDLPPGEYILLNTQQKAVNDLGDVKCYSFTIQ